MKALHLSKYSSAVATGLVAILILIGLHPIILQYFQTRFLGGSFGDGGLYVSLTTSFIQNPKQALAFETSSLYPYPLTRAWSDSFILPASFALFLSKLGLSIAFAYNTTILGAFFLNAISIFALARRIGITPHFATAAAVIFTNSSYILGNLGHPQLLFFFWVPAAWRLILPIQMPSGGYIRPSSRNWLYAGLCMAGAFYTTVYYAIFIALGLGVIWLLELIKLKSSPRRALRSILFTTLGALPLAYALPRYLAVQKYFGARGLHEAEHFSATGLSYIAHTHLHDLFPITSKLTHTEAYLSPGYTTLLIAIIYGLFGAWKRSHKLTIVILSAVSILCVASSVVDQGKLCEHLVCISAWVLLGATYLLLSRYCSAATTLTLLGVLFFVLSFGPGGNLSKNEPVYAPLGLLYERVPGLAAIRAVGRFGGVTIMALILLATRALQEVTRYGTQLQRSALALAFMAIALVDNSVSSIPFDTPSATPMAFYALNKRDPGHQAAIILPLSGELKNEEPASWSEFAILNSQYSLWQNLSLETTESSPMPIVNGYSGQRTKLQKELPKLLSDFPSERSLSALYRISGLHWIVVIPGLYQKWDGARFEQALVDFRHHFGEVKRFNDDSILIELKGALSISAASEVQVFFAPRDLKQTLSIMPTTDSHCEVSAAIIGKSQSGEKIQLHAEKLVATSQRDIDLPLLKSPQISSPQIIEVTASGCQGQITLKPASD